MKRVIAFLCAAFTLFLCLWLVIAVPSDAGRILTPQERIDRISAIPREYGARPYREKDRVHISGVARTWDGKPVSARSLPPYDATVRMTGMAGPPT